MAVVMFEAWFAVGIRIRADPDMPQENASEDPGGPVRGVAALSGAGAGRRWRRAVLPPISVLAEVARWHLPRQWNR